MNVGMLIEELQRFPHSLMVVVEDASGETDYREVAEVKSISIHLVDEDGHGEVVQDCVSIQQRLVIEG